MQTYVRSDSVVSRVIAGETLIVPVRKGVGDLASIYSLNEVGSTIWSVLSQPRTTGDIVASVEQEFEGDRQRIAQDVDSFLTEMVSAGLVSATGAWE
ncbi:MAG TPA: PqqD family protein [Terriglobales bacterium]|nr:PqqD family protein [Terriglobales bacterium]